MRAFQKKEKRFAYSEYLLSFNELYTCTNDAKYKLHIYIDMNTIYTYMKQYANEMIS